MYVFRLTMRGLVKFDGRKRTLSYIGFGEIEHRSDIRTVSEPGNGVFFLYRSHQPRQPADQ